MGLKKYSKGFTLIEAAVVILLLSIALVPVIKMVSHTSGDGSGDLNTGITSGRSLSEEQAVANAIMEKAVAGDTSVVHPVVAQDGSILGFDATGKFVKLDSTGAYTTTVYNPETDKAPESGNVPAASSHNTTARTITYPKYQYESTDIYYQWVVKDSTMQEYDPDGTGTAPSEYTSFMPEGNSLVKAVLKVYSGPGAKTSTTPDYSVSTYFFKNTSDAIASGDQFSDKIGIVFAVDVSLSMKMSNVVGTNGNDFFENAAPLAVPLFQWRPGYEAGTPLPLRMSSGIYGYDPAAVSSPYLVYRSGVNDLFFGTKTDDPITPYDERYNPCLIPASGNEDLPYSAGLDATAINSKLSEYCDNFTNPHIPYDGGSGYRDIFVKVPTRPVSSITSSFTSYFDDSDANWAQYVMGGYKNATFGTECTNESNIDTGRCYYYTSAGVRLFTDAEALDSIKLNDAASYLFGQPDNPVVIQNYLSRIEAARTALLSFVLTIENNSELVNNFRLGFVPFSTEVQDGSYSGLNIGPNEVQQLEAPASGTATFNGIKSRLLRINRACAFSGTQYHSDIPSCPGTTQPITLSGQTNLAHALYHAKDIFDTYEASHDPLAKKLVILLTDGAPTSTADGLASGIATSDSSSEPGRLGTLATNLATNDEIEIYSVGLMTAGDPDAVAALTAISSVSVGDVRNVNVNVDTVGNLTPVFESIAQQAERFALEQMQARYSYLNKISY